MIFRTIFLKSINKFASVTKCKTPTRCVNIQCLDNFWIFIIFVEFKDKQKHTKVFDGFPYFTHIQQRYPTFHYEFMSLILHRSVQHQVSLPYFKMRIQLKSIRVVLFYSQQNKKTRTIDKIKQKPKNCVCYIW